MINTVTSLGAGEGSEGTSTGVECCGDTAEPQSPILSTFESDEGELDVPWRMNCGGLALIHGS